MVLLRLITIAFLLVKLLTPDNSPHAFRGRDMPLGNKAVPLRSGPNVIQLPKLENWTTRI